MQTWMLIAALAVVEANTVVPGVVIRADGYHYSVQVETAAAVAQPLDRTIASTTVITADEIRGSGLTQVADLLRRVAGVDVSRSGSAGKVTLARIDGASSSQTLVLVDGVEINSPTLAVADLADLSLDNVEKIEVVRGPMSALYGSSAMGGVIQIFTRRGQGATSGSADVSGGTFSTLRGSAVVGGAPSERFSWSVAGSRTTADGRAFETPAGPLEHDAYENTTASAAFTTALGDHTTLSFDGRYTDAIRDLPIEVFGARAFDVNSTQSDESAIAALRVRGAMGSFTPSLRLEFLTAEQNFDDPKDPGEDGPYASDFSSVVKTRRLAAAGQGDWRISEQNLLTAGLGFERRQGENTDSFSGPNFDSDVDTFSVFAQNRFDVKAVALELGARLDDIDGYGSKVSPKASVLWRPFEQRMRVRAGAGRGFRAPSLNELVFPFYGNPELEPETSWTWEAAVGGHLLENRVDLELRGFRTDFDNLIATDPTTFTAVNLDEARIEGAELTLRVWPATGWWVSGSATLQRARDRSNDEELVRRPGRKGVVSFGYEKREYFRLGFDLLAVGAQRDVQVAGFPEQNPSWTRVDLAGAVTLPFAARRLELFGRVENVLDAEYSETTGFPAPGVNGQGGVRLRF